MTSNSRDSLLLSCILASVFLSKQREKRDTVEDLRKHLLPKPQEA